MLLMTFATKSLSSVPVAFTRLVIRAVTNVAGLAKALVHRREVLRLTELDERSLKDIGLVRSDVEGALATSWLRDPSSVLAARSQQGANVAADRREEGLRQSAVKPPAQARAETVLACSA